jgi:Protein of unknown function (DUF669).
MFDVQAILKDDNGSTASGPIPSGWYTAKINRFERRQNKQGNGDHLWMEFDVEVNGSSRRAWHRFNIGHQNPKAVEVSMKELARLFASCGYNSIQNEWNPTEVLDVACEIHLEQDGTYNNVTAYRAKADAVKPEQKLYGTAPANKPDVDDEIPF